MARPELGSFERIKQEAEKDKEPLRSFINGVSRLAGSLNADFSEPGHKYIVLLIDTTDENSPGFFKIKSEDDRRRGLCMLSFESSEGALEFARECNQESATGDEKERHLEAFPLTLEGTLLR